MVKMRMFYLVLLKNLGILPKNAYLCTVYIICKGINVHKYVKK